MKTDVKLLLAHVEQKLIKTLHEHPSKEALNRLAIFAGFQDWESFRREIRQDADEEKEKKK